ncbi:basic salivary proline-rich protein 2-like [Marmota monax]|uniref:basic salivary proline-rich protein 2-like n=1 Tax=Marmota monax TaxID=9995 RepID=UPI001EB069FD|nr:basic salivary proline-rich protein 2-like [Marmota monax]
MGGKDTSSPPDSWVPQRAVHGPGRGPHPSTAGLTPKRSHLFCPHPSGGRGRPGACSPVATCHTGSSRGLAAVQAGRGGSTARCPSSLMRPFICLVPPGTEPGPARARPVPDHRPQPPPLPGTLWLLFVYEKATLSSVAPSPPHEHPHEGAARVGSRGASSAPREPRRRRVRLAGARAAVGLGSPAQPWRGPGRPPAFLKGPQLRSVDSGAVDPDSGRVPERKPQPSGRARLVVAARWRWPHSYRGVRVLLRDVSTDPLLRSPEGVLSASLRPRAVLPRGVFVEPPCPARLCRASQLLHAARTPASATASRAPSPQAPRCPRPQAEGSPRTRDGPCRWRGPRGPGTAPAGGEVPQDPGRPLQAERSPPGPVTAPAGGGVPQDPGRPLQAERSPRTRDGPCRRRGPPRTRDGPCRWRGPPGPGTAPAGGGVPQDPGRPLQVDGSPQDPSWPLQVEGSPEDPGRPLQVEGSPRTRDGPCRWRGPPGPGTAPAGGRVPQDPGRPLQVEGPPRTVTAPAGGEVPQDPGRPLQVEGSPRTRDGPCRWRGPPGPGTAPAGGGSPEDPGRPLQVERSPRTRHGPCRWRGPPRTVTAPAGGGVPEDRP